MVKKRLYRASKRDSLLAGVAAGIANYLDLDPVLVRLLWVVVSLAWGLGIVVYLVAWIIMPRK